MSMGDKNKINFGIMCSGFRLRKFHVECIKEILKIDNTELKLLIFNDNYKQGLSFAQKIIRTPFNEIFYKIFLRLFARSGINEIVDFSESLKNITILKCKTNKKGKFSEYFFDEDIQKIRDHDLDFILRFDFGIIRGEILNVPRFGVWSFHSGDEQKYRGLPPCFWEIYHNDNVSGAILQRLTNRLDGGVILKKGFLKTINDSYVKNLESVYREMKNWPAQVCKDINNGITGYLDNAPSKTEAKIYYLPNNLELILFVFKLIKNFLKNRLKSLFIHEFWNVGIIDGPIIKMLEKDYEYKINFIKYKEKNRFIADPFGFYINNELNIVCEEFNFNDFRGSIVNLKINKDFSLLEKKEVLKNDEHVSYPYVINDQNNIFCVPEISRLGELNIYQIDDQGKWNKVSTIIKDKKIIDPSIIYHDGFWWLFGTILDNGKFHNLFLWYSSDLKGPWMPHKNNPVKTDVRSSRSAGSIFRKNNVLYRPAQDCSIGYGKRIVINKIEKLNIFEFKEDVVSVIEPDKHSFFSDGVHTISSVGNITLIDGKKECFMLKGFVYIFKRKFFNILKNGKK